jgi:maltooligosyltrehalose synthase
VWLLFQTLAELWPTTARGEQEREELRSRVQAYMLKAVREAKQETSWTSPVSAYEDALAHYIDGILRPGAPNPFVEELDRLAGRVTGRELDGGGSGTRLALAQVFGGASQLPFTVLVPAGTRPGE